jgi:plasmid stabilization system protein ParE
MRISRSPIYLANLYFILEYIAKDKIAASKNFHRELDELINNIPSFPYKYRQSIYFNDVHIRDLIYKGYTVVYRIDEIKENIDVLRIFNKNQPPVG